MTPFSRIFFKLNFFFLYQKRITENIFCPSSSLFISPLATDLISSLPYADVIVLESSAAPAVQPGAARSACKYIFE